MFVYIIVNISIFFCWKGSNIKKERKNKIKQAKKKKENNNNKLKLPILTFYKSIQNSFFLKSSQTGLLLLLLMLLVAMDGPVRIHARLS